MQPLHLIQDAGRVWSRLWSVRLALLAGGLGALEVGLTYCAPEHASPLYAAGAALVSFAAAVARIVAQPAVIPAPDLTPPTTPTTTPPPTGDTPHA